MSGTGRNSHPIAHLQPTYALIEAYRRSGRPEDFERLVQRFAALVLSECRRTAGNLHDAEDASQLAFLALAMEIKAGVEIHRVGPWLQRVARRQALKIVRSRSRRKRREDAVRRSELSEHALEERIDAAIEGGIIRDHIDQLPERYRVPLVLHYFGGMPLALIAAELKLTPAAVGTRLHRGRKMLGGRLSQSGLVFHNGSFEAAMASAVPAAVVATLVRVASDGAVHTVGSNGAGLVGASLGIASISTGVIELLRAVGSVAARRPLLAALVATVLAGGGSGLAWRVAPPWLKSPTGDWLNLGSWLRSLIPATPSLRSDLHAKPMPLVGADAPATPSAGVPLPPPISGWPAHAPEMAFIPSPLGVAAPGPVPRTTDAGVPPIPLSNIASVLIQPTGAMPDAVIHRPPALAQSFPRLISPDLRGGTGASRPPPAPGSTGGDRASIFVVAGQHASVDGAAHFQQIDVGLASPGARGPARLSIPRGARLHVDHLRVGLDASVPATVAHDGAWVTADRVEIGVAGAGSYLVSNGGRLDAASLTLGVLPSSRGELRVTDGEVRLTDARAGVTVGADGVGRLVLGSTDAPGRLTTAGPSIAAPLVIGATSDAASDSSISGWGMAGTGGTLTNNGRVVADGHDRTRPLDLTNFTRVNNTIDNPADGGGNGWYVSRGGRLQLPPIRLEATARQTITWGESDDDPTLDLVNSVRMTIYDQTAPGDLHISLRTLAVTETPDVRLPERVSVLSLFEIDSHTFDPAAVDVIVRYNDAAAAAFHPGESALQLFAFEDDAWSVLEGLWLDRQNKLVGGSIDGAFDLLAVGIPWDWNLDRPRDELPPVLSPRPIAPDVLPDGGLIAPSGLTDTPLRNPMEAVDAIEPQRPHPPANVPEPAALLVVAAPGLLWRRVRRGH